MKMTEKSRGLEYVIYSLFFLLGDLLFWIERLISHFQSLDGVGWFLIFLSAVFFAVSFFFLLDGFRYGFFYYNDELEMRGAISLGLASVFAYLQILYFLGRPEIMLSFWEMVWLVVSPTVALLFVAVLFRLESRF